MILGDLNSFDSVDKGKFLLYGGGFTVLVDVILYPLELIKTRVQVEAVSRATMLEGTLRVAQDVWTREGVRGLYRGFGMFALGGLPSQGAYFYGYNWSRQQLGKMNGSLPSESQLPLFALDMCAGLFADVIAAPLWTPMEVVSTRLQLQGPGVVKNSGSWDAATSIFRAEGVRGLFRGLSASIFAFGPASALWWATYQWSRRRLTEGGHEGVWVDAVSGFAAGIISTVLTNPLELAKTRLQAQGGLLREFHLDRVAEAAVGGGRRREASSRHSRVRQSGVGGGLEAKVGQITHPPSVPPPCIPEATDRSSRAHLRLELEKRLVWTSQNPRRLDAKAASLCAGSMGGVGRRALMGAGSLAMATPLSLAAAPAGLGLGGGGSGGVSSSASLLSAAGAAVRKLGGLGGWGPSPLRLSTWVWGGGGGAVEVASSSLLAELAALERRAEERARARGTLGPHGGGGASVVPPVGFSPLSSSSSPVGGPSVPTTMLGMLSHIVTRDGPRALIRGLLPRLIINGPASVATFVAYEQVMTLSRLPKLED